MKGIFVRMIELLGWELLTYENRSELTEEFAKRNIQINQNADIGDFPKIWNDVTINSGAIVGHNVTIGRNTKIQDLAWVGDNVVIEKFCTIGEFASIDEASYIGSGVNIGKNAKIGRRSYIGRGAVIPEGKEVVTISFNLGKHTVYYWGTDVLQIGCKVFHIDSWKNDFRQIGTRERYREEQIELYGKAIQVVRMFRTEKPAPAPLGTHWELPKGDTVTFGGESFPAA